MKTRSIISGINTFISLCILALEYFSAGYRWILLGFILLGLFWVFINFQADFWVSSSLFLVIVILAAIGITIGMSLIAMVIVCTSSLVSWELSLFNQSMGGYPLIATNTTIDKYHSIYLMLTVFTGMGLALISSSFNFQFPFGVIVILVLISLGCLFFGIQLVLKSTHSQSQIED